MHVPAKKEKNNFLMAKAVADELQLPVEAVYTASTGVIGKQLPIDIIKRVSLSWLRN